MLSNPKATATISIFGQIVIDHAVNVDFPHETADLFGKGIQWNEEGIVTIDQNVKLSVPCIIPPKAARTIFSLPAGRVKTGAKINATEVETVPWGHQTDNEIRFGFDRQLPGGGAMNVAFGLYNIFRGIPVSLVSVYSKEQDTMLEDALRPLFVSGGLKLIKIDPHPSVNLILEGIMEDRIIIRSPRVRDISVEYQEAEGEFVMVNSVYSREFSVNALLECMRAPAGGTIACTASLCHPELFNSNEAAKFTALLQDKLGSAAPALTTEHSIYSIIKDIVMPSSDKITYIFNEDELAHFIALTTDSFDVMYRGRQTGALFSGILRALKELRLVQQGTRPPIVVTLGVDGALYLDSESNLHYCGVMTDEQMGRKIYGEKKAIGDLFASVITGVSYGRGDRGIVPVRNGGQEVVIESAAPSILLAASATADVGVYDGFLKAKPEVVSELLPKKASLGHYLYLGPLADIDVSRCSAMFAEIQIEKFKKGTISESDVCLLENLVEPGLILAL